MSETLCCLVDRDLELEVPVIVELSEEVVHSAGKTRQVAGLSATGQIGFFVEAGEVL